MTSKALKIGDKVRFLNDVGEGVVTQVLENDCTWSRMTMDLNTPSVNRIDWNRKCENRVAGVRSSNSHGLRNLASGNYSSTSEKSGEGV